METRAASVQLAEGVVEPDVVFGPPEALQGALRLHNPGESRVRVRALAVVAPTLRGPAGLPLTRARVVARLEPGQQGTAHLRLEVDPATPPGTYQAEVAVGDARRPLQVVVCESLQARIEPRQLTLFTEGQLRFETTYVVQNQGNVPFPTGAVCTAPLFAADRAADLPVAALAAGPEPSADQLLRELLLAQARPVGVVRITREGALVRPGQTVVGQAAIEVPAGLASHRHYYTLLELYGVQGRIDVYTGKMRRPRSTAG
jgi:hypothetical protein